MDKHVPSEREVETFTGDFVDVSKPTAEVINIEDIAHALSNVCRYGGHCKTFYSVAEHAVFVSKRLERKGYGKSTQLLGLHHDDAEAYLGDIPRPIKPMLGPKYKTLNEKMEAVIFEALDIEHDGDPLTHDAIKEADNWSLFVEARHLLPSQGKTWDQHSEGRTWSAGQPERIVIPDYWLGGVSPFSARELYLERHRELTS